MVFDVPAVVLLCHFTPLNLQPRSSLTFFFVSPDPVEKKDWFNIFTIQSITFPPDTLKTGFVPAGQTLLDETYSVTALDPSSKVSIVEVLYSLVCVPLRERGAGRGILR